MKLKEFVLKTFLSQNVEPTEPHLRLEEAEVANYCTEHSFVIFIDGPLVTGNCRFCDEPIENHPKSNPFITIH